MPSARELLDQADALMRRNRAGVIDTEIPELTEMTAMVAPAPVAPPVVAATSAPAVLDDVPELTEAVEEIEIESIVELPEPVEAISAAADDWARWEVLADEIRMQVLQRIDIFTDTRLRDELSAQLQPIVDRASAEIVSTINAHVGGLLRAYIAEAIEREIEKWRGAAP